MFFRFLFLVPGDFGLIEAEMIYSSGPARWGFSPSIFFLIPCLWNSFSCCASWGFCWGFFRPSPIDRTMDISHVELACYFAMPILFFDGKNVRFLANFRVTEIDV